MPKSNNIPKKNAHRSRQNDKPDRSFDENGKEVIEDFDASEAPSPKADPQLKTLIRLGSEATLFRTASGEYYAHFPVKGHYETHRINEQGGAFRKWLTWRYNLETKGSPSNTAMAQVMELFAARAEFEGQTEDVHTRIAYTDTDDTLYLDLGTEDWKAVKITGDGWEVVKDYPVLFRRPNGIKPMPIPERGGSLNDLRPFINVVGEDDWKMLVGWLLGVFHPKGPYPILAISGEQGTAKSNATKLVRDLVDPNAAPTRDAPKDISDLVIAAKNSRVLALDNLSGMPVWMADALCRMATGSGYGKRALYTDDQEALFNDRRPVVFNGIEELNSRGDLAARCLTIALEPITEDGRKTEEGMERPWVAAKPRILGALLDAVAVALRERHNVKVPKLPRMADFTVWVCAAEKHLSWKKGSFLETYKHNRDSAVQLEVESSPVASAVIAFMKSRNNQQWDGGAASLYELLKPYTPQTADLLKQWPVDAVRLSGKLSRVSPALRASGIDIVKGSSNGSRYITIAPIKSDGKPLDSDGKSDESDGTAKSTVTAQTPDFEPVERRNRGESDGSDGKFPTFSILESKEKKRKERVIEKPGKTSSLSSLSSLSAPSTPTGNGGYLVNSAPPKETPCSLCGKHLWVLAKSGEGDGFVCRKCHSDIAA